MKVNKVNPGNHLQLLHGGYKGNWSKIKRLTSSQPLIHTVECLMSQVYQIAREEEHQSNLQEINNLKNRNEELESLVRKQARLIKNDIEIRNNEIIEGKDKS